MSNHETTKPQPNHPHRRGFLKTALTTGLLVKGVELGQPARTATAATTAVEWRNEQPGMSYRKLGRTGMMISEVVSGGDPITLENYKQLELALEMGLNYLDMAPAYNQGNCERAYGKLLAGSSARREKVYLTTKISGFSQIREHLYKELFDKLPEGKQEAILKRAHNLKTRRGVEKPGYFLTYFPGQMNAFDPAYLALAMQRDYADQVDGSDALRKHMVESIEGSLKRVGTDYFDLAMCPHGATTPEELDCPEILAVFNDLKQQGKVRFLGVTSHNDPAGILRKAAQLGHYDAVMMAYNVVNGGYVEEAIRFASGKDVGIIAMKAAMAVATHHKSLQPVPDWRIQKVERIVPGEMKAPVKAYLWALQNQGISAVISNLWDETFVKENLAVAGQKVDMQPA